MTVDIKDIARSLASNVLSVCQELIPDGKIEAHEWVHDPGAGKIKVVLQGQKAGIWSHWGGDGAGDLLDLYVKIRGGTIGDALDWARDRLGIEKPAFQGAKPRQYERPKPPEQMRPLQRSSVIDSVDLYLRQERGLAPATTKLFRIAEAPYLDGVKDGKPWRWTETFILFPFFVPRRDQPGKFDLTNIKWQTLKRYESKSGKMRPKRIQEKNNEPGLFGWQAASPTARRCLILEGEIDAMTAHQYLVELGRSDAIAAFSVPAGCGRGEKQQWIEQQFDMLERFEDIVICFDGDKEGEDKVAMEEIIRRLGLHRCRVMKLPGHKDTNAALLAGMTAEEYWRHYEAAKTPAPDELRSAAEFVEEVVEKFYPSGDAEPGLPLPWSRMRWMRIRRREVSVWTGINGHGKSLLLNQVTMHLCDRGERACIGSFEMPPAELLKNAVKQLSQARKPSQAHIRALHRWFDGRLWIVDRIGTMDLKRLLEVFTYARRRFGCCFFVVDSFLRLGIGEDDYNAQKAAAEVLVRFADIEDCHIALVAHSRKLKDATKAPGRLDVKGVGAITDLAQVCGSVWRNEDKEQKLSSLDDDQTLTGAKREERRADLVNKPDAILSFDKQRFGTGKIGNVKLWFDEEAMSFREKIGGDLPRFDTVPADFAAPRDGLS